MNLWFFLTNELVTFIQRLESQTESGQGMEQNVLVKTAVQNGFRKPFCKRKPESVQTETKFRIVFCFV